MLTIVSIEPGNLSVASLMLKPLDEVNYSVCVYVSLEKQQIYIMYLTSHNSEYT